MDAEGASSARRSAHLVEGELTHEIIGACLEVRTELGRNYAESVYRNAVMLVLEEHGIRSEREYPVTVRFRGREVGTFRCDLLVEDRILVEIKAGRPLDAACEAQLLSYLKATGLRVGLLIHFGDRVTTKRMVL